MATLGSHADGGPRSEKKKEDRCNHDAATMTTCDYLVVGGGATGMAFVDTLLAHSSSDSAPSVVMIDKHAGPGGQWNDSYSFVRLHQPSAGYGVETEEMGPAAGASGASEKQHRATRAEILEYYRRVQRKLEAKHDFRFVGGATFDFSAVTEEGVASSADGVPYRLRRSDGGTTIVCVAKRVVDARFLEPDLPVSVPPTFSYDGTVIQCVPINALAGQALSSKHYVVIGGGKTGMDAIAHLQTKLEVEPNDIMWVVPNDAWITARESIGSCMEFLHTCTELAKRKTLELEDETGGDEETALGRIVTSDDFFQNGFLEWERRGKVYRLDEGGALPTKFKDATLCKDEMATIKRVTKVVRHRGRVRSIGDGGDLRFEDGTTVPLPWSSSSGGGGDSSAVGETTFVHCSAGAFNYTKQPDSVPPPVFGERVITIRDVYGTPGFCFVGSVIGKLESMGKSLSDADKNAMCLAPEPDASQAKPPLGPSGGDIGVISRHHGFVQRLSNLKMWLDAPGMKTWLVGHRLFNLGHLGEEEIATLVEQTWEVLEDCGLVDN